MKLIQRTKNQFEPVRGICPSELISKYFIDKKKLILINSMLSDEIGFTIT